MRYATQKALGRITGLELEGTGAVYFRLVTANSLIDCGLSKEEQQGVTTLGSSTHDRLTLF